ncbi:MAG: RNA polymerase sigma factor [Bacillota bacterium]
MRAADEYDLKPAADPFVPPTDETRIIRRLSAGDEEALGILMDRYGGALLHFAHRLVGDMQMAEEITQDTMLKAWQQAGSFRMDGHLKAWLFRVARNNAIDYIRRKRLPTEEFQSAHDTASVEQQPEREAERSWLTEAILEALEELPEQYRDVIEMRFFQDMCYQEIAETLKIPLGTVKSRLNYALKGLTRVLMERGIGPDLLDT